MGVYFLRPSRYKRNFLRGCYKFPMISNDTHKWEQETLPTNTSKFHNNVTLVFVYIPFVNLSVSVICLNTYMPTPTRHLGNDHHIILVIFHGKHIMILYCWCWCSILLYTVLFNTYVFGMGRPIASRFCRQGGLDYTQSNHQHSSLADESLSCTHQHKTNTLILLPISLSINIIIITFMHNEINTRKNTRILQQVSRHIRKIINTILPQIVGPFHWEKTNEKFTRTTRILLQIRYLYYQ